LASIAFSPKRCTPGHLIDGGGRIVEVNAAAAAAYIAVLDHLIVTTNSFLSFKQRAFL